MSLTNLLSTDILSAYKAELITPNKKYEERRSATVFIRHGFKDTN